MADESFSVRGDLQGMVPPVKLHGEERSRPLIAKVVVTRNLPSHRALFACKARKGRPLRGRPFSSRDTRTVPHP